MAIADRCSSLVNEVTPGDGAEVQQALHRSRARRGRRQLRQFRARKDHLIAEFRIPRRRSSLRLGRRLRPRQPPVRQEMGSLPRPPHVKGRHIAPRSPARTDPTCARGLPSQSRTRSRRREQANNVVAAATQRPSATVWSEPGPLPPRPQLQLSRQNKGCRGTRPRPASHVHHPVRANDITTSSARLS